MTSWLTLKQVGGSTKGRGETCRQIRQDRRPTCKQLRHRRQRGTKPIGRRAIGVLSILQGLTICNIFLRVRTSFGCLEKNLQPTDGRWPVHPQIQHKLQHVQSCTAWSHFITRTRVAQAQWLHIFVSTTFVIHVSSLVLSRTWHWPPAQVLSHPFHPLLLSFRRSHLCTQALWSSTLKYPAMFHGRVADQHKSHLSQVMSPRPSRPKQSSLKTSSPEELSLTGILGQIRIKDRKDLWETLLLEIWTNLEKLVQRCPNFTDAFRLWLSGEHCRLGSWIWRTAKKLASPLS